MLNESQYKLCIILKVLVTHSKDQSSSSLHGETKKKVEWNSCPGNEMSGKSFQISSVINIYVVILGKGYGLFKDFLVKNTDF